MRALRLVLVLAIAMLAIRFVDSLVWQPARCNGVVRRAQASALALWNAPETPARLNRARGEVAALQQCATVTPTDVNLYMTIAAHDRILGRFDHAAEMYNTALRYDRRPEIYFNLGVVNLTMGDREAGVRDLLTACRFDIAYSDDIPDIEARRQVLETLAAERR